MRGRFRWPQQPQAPGKCLESLARYLGAYGWHPVLALGCVVDVDASTMHTHAYPFGSNEHENDPEY